MSIIKFYVLGHLIACGAVMGCFAGQGETLLPHHYEGGHHKPYHGEHKSPHQELLKIPSPHQQTMKSGFPMEKEVNKIVEKIDELNRHKEILLSIYGNKKDRDINLYIGPYNASIAALEKLKNEVEEGREKDVEKEIYYIFEEYFPQDDD